MGIDRSKYTELLDNHDLEGVLQRALEDAVFGNRHVVVRINGFVFIASPDMGPIDVYMIEDETDAEGD